MKKNNKGFSLVEILVSLPIALVVLGSVGAAIIAFYSMSTQTKENISTEQELNLMVNTLRSATRLAINVRQTTTDLSGTGSDTASGAGFVRDNFTYSRFADLTPVSTPLMYFARETAFQGTSVPRATALFFVAPTATAPGQLQLTLSNAPGAQNLIFCPATGVCASNPAPSIRLNNVVGVKLFDGQSTQRLRMMNSVKLAVTVRSFIAGSSKPRRYCPQPDFAASCTDGAPYRDFVRTIVLQFDNNRLESTTPGLDLPYGVYFFRSSGPRWTN